MSGQERKKWAKTVISLSVLVAVASTPLILIANRNIDPDGYPAVWKLLLASVDAGVQEEIFSRLFLITILSWLGGLIWQEQDGRPTHAVFWIAILITGLIFGWGHVDDKLVIPGIPFLNYFILMVVSTAYGIVFGWLYWKLGIECAILTHFAIDVMASVIVVPAILSENPFWQLVALIGIMIFGGLAWNLLKRTERITNKSPKAL